MQVREKKVLLIRQKNKPDTREYWTLPAGKVEKSELLTDFLAR